VSKAENRIKVICPFCGSTVLWETIDRTITYVQAEAYCHNCGDAVLIKLIVEKKLRVTRS
jgi:DNA-directed RNA polymerase subunit RPC12/RpoP